MKKLVEIYYTYGKNSGEEINEQFVMEDDTKNRVELIENEGHGETYDSVEDFISGKIDLIHYNTYGGDWDDPTGRFIVIRTKEDAIHSITEEAKREINEINKLFE